MSTSNLGIIKSEDNPLKGTRVQLNTGSWFIAESSAVSKSKIENNKTQTITENGEGIEITPSSGKDAMEKVTLTVNVPTGGVTPPEWFTNGKDSVPPDTLDYVLFCGYDLQFDTYYLLKEPDGTKTLAELSEYTITSASFLCYIPSSSGDIPCFDVEVESEP